MFIEGRRSNITALHVIYIIHVKLFVYRYIYRYLRKHLRNFYKLEHKMFDIQKARVIENEKARKNKKQVYE